jgi:hypothetical protein
MLRAHQRDHQIAENRNLPVLAQPLSPRTGQQMDPVGIRKPVSRARGACAQLSTAPARAWKLRKRAI